jgi:uncharacterized protein with gpF-like domain
MKDNIWEPHRRIELTYQKALRRLLNRIWREIKFLNDPFDIIDKFESIGDSQVFESFANTLASNMITATLFDTARSWREAAKEGSRGRLIYQLLRNELNGPVGVAVNKQIAENAYYIKSMPLDFATTATKHIAAQQQAGRRSSDIARDLLNMFPSMSENKARLIARTETSKANSSLTQARAESLGLNWYRWRGSLDQRERKAHRYLEGVLINFNDPPSPEALLNIKSSLGHYHAGNCPNCRCYEEVIVDIDLISFPAKVYQNGSIKSMTKSQFKRIM